MKPIPLSPEILEVARRVIWFEPPEQALANAVRFMAYAMTYARHEDMRVIRHYVSDDDFREALDDAPPGIIDPRSWAYWNSKLGRYPPPPLPTRRFGNDIDSDASNPTQQSRSSSDIEEIQRRAATAWKKMREQQPSPDAEEVQRRARENWLAQYGPPKKP